MLKDAYLSRIYYSQGLLAAIEACKSQLSLDIPDKDELLLSLALLYFLDEESPEHFYDDSLATLEEAARRRPLDPEVSFWLGYVGLIVSSDETKPLLDLKECLLAMPDHAYANLVLSDCDIAEHEKQKCLEVALAIQPNNYRTLLSYAATFLSLNPAKSHLAISRILSEPPFIETEYGFMNDYINDVFTQAVNADEVRVSAEKLLAELTA